MLLCLSLSAPRTSNSKLEESLEACVAYERPEPTLLGVCSFSLFCLSSAQKMLSRFSEARALRIHGFPRDVRVEDTRAKDEFGELATSIGRTLEHLGQLPNRLLFIRSYRVKLPNKTPIL